MSSPQRHGACQIANMHLAHAAQRTLSCIEGRSGHKFNLWTCLHQPSIIRPKDENRLFYTQKANGIMGTACAGWACRIYPVC
eukprot:15453995-Alexandrium_andersonii.AAC.1